MKEPKKSPSRAKAKGRQSDDETASPWPSSESES